MLLTVWSEGRCEVLITHCWKPGREVIRWRVQGANSFVKVKTKEVMLTKMITEIVQVANTFVEVPCIRKVLPTIWSGGRCKVLTPL